MNLLSRLLLGKGNGRLSKDQFILFLLLVTAMVGPGLSYGAFYLFYFVLIFYLGFQVLNKRELFIQDLKEIATKPSNLFLIISPVYFATWILFSGPDVHAIKHLFFICIGFSLSILIIKNAKSFESITFVIRCLTFVYCIDLLIGLLEAAQLFRWPISKISTINDWFGRSNLLGEILATTSSESYVYSMPTGFHWNPNNFATVAIIGLPFFIFNKRYIVSLIGILSIVILTVAAGAKLSFIAAIFIAIVSLVFVKRHCRQVATLIIVLCFFLTGGFNLSIFKPSLKVKEIKSLVFEVESESEKKLNESSVSYRMLLIDEGINMFKDNPILGVGGGGSEQILKQKGGIGKYNITNLHNYWLELLVEGGILYFLFFLVWVLSHLKKILAGLSLLDKDSKSWYFTVSILVGVFGFFVSSISTSSLYGFLPFYILIGLVSAISLNLKKES